VLNFTKVGLLSTLCLTTLNASESKEETSLLSGVYSYISTLTSLPNYKSSAEDNLRNTTRRAAIAAVSKKALVQSETLELDRQQKSKQDALTPSHNTTLKTSQSIFNEIIPAEMATEHKNEKIVIKKEPVKQAYMYANKKKKPAKNVHITEAKPGATLPDENFNLETENLSVQFASVISQALIIYNPNQDFCPTPYLIKESNETSHKFEETNIAPDASSLLTTSANDSAVILTEPNNTPVNQSITTDQICKMASLEQYPHILSSVPPITATLEELKFNKEDIAVTEKSLPLMENPQTRAEYSLQYQQLIQIIKDELKSRIGSNFSNTIQIICGSFSIYFNTYEDQYSKLFYDNNNKSSKKSEIECIELIKDLNESLKDSYNSLIAYKHDYSQTWIPEVDEKDLRLAQSKINTSEDLGILSKLPKNIEEYCEQYHLLISKIKKQLASGVSECYSRKAQAQCGKLTMLFNANNKALDVLTIKKINEKLENEYKKIIAYKRDFQLINEITKIVSEKQKTNEKKKTKKRSPMQNQGVKRCHTRGQYQTDTSYFSCQGTGNVVPVFDNSAYDNSTSDNSAYVSADQWVPDWYIYDPYSGMFFYWNYAWPNPESNNAAPYL
jgi:hypothetical protein